MYFIGTMGAPHFAMLMTFALIGATIKLTQHVSQRDVESSATPRGFSLWFLIADNWKRMLNSLLLIYIFVRFTNFFLPASLYESLPDEVEMISAIVIGFSFDSLSQWLKDKIGLLTVNRNKIMGNGGN